MGAENRYVPPQEPTFIEMPEPRYRVEDCGDPGECNHCGQACEMWTIVYDDENGEPTEIGQSWGHKETAEDICDLMNMAYLEGQASNTVGKT